MAPSKPRPCISLKVVWQFSAEYVRISKYAMFRFLPPISLLSLTPRPQQKYLGISRIANERSPDASVLLSYTLEGDKTPGPWWLTGLPVRSLRNSTRPRIRHLIGGVSSSTATSVATTVAPSRCESAPTTPGETSAASATFRDPAAARHARECLSALG